MDQEAEREALARGRAPSAGTGAEAALLARRGEEGPLLAQIDDEQQHLQHHPHPHHYNLGEWAAGADFGEPREFNYYAEVGAARLILGGWADLKRGRGGCVDVSEL